MEKPEKAKVVRKKVACQECGLLCAANVMRRHLEKHRKAEAYAPIEITREAYAPIEITPTKVGLLSDPTYYNSLPGVLGDE